MGCLYSRILYHNVPDLSAAGYFDARRIEAASHPVPLRHATSAFFFRAGSREERKHRTFDELLEANGTRAFLVLRDDVVIYERYFGGVTATSLLPGFSMTKTFAAVLVGCAVDDGLFTSVDDRVSQYVPELGAKSGYRDITLEHLLRMTSGIDFEDESVSGALFYYSKDLRSRMYSYDVRWAPGSHYLYGSVDIQILWDALQRRLNGRGRTVSRYFQERVWSRLGAVDDASWALDSAENGVEKFFGGLSATARDHARLGLLFLHGGTINGDRILPAAWVAAALEPDPIAGALQTSDGWVRRGMYQWYLTHDGRAYFAKGLRGQYVFVVPEKNLVFVRFAEGYGDLNWPALMMRIADAN
jgi:CubicO group peptidase (beta-lactamase class C family)